MLVQLKCNNVLKLMLTAEPQAPRVSSISFSQDRITHDDAEPLQIPRLLMFWRHTDYNQESIHRKLR